MIHENYHDKWNGFLRSLSLLQLLCVHLYVEKRQSGDKLELLLDSESLLDAAYLVKVMESMIMIMRSEEED